MNKKLLIIDGHNYLFRAYYGIPSTARLSNGIKVNAFYGFMSFLRRILKQYEPNKIVIIFDSEEGISKKKHTRSSYKENREYNDTSIFEQLIIIQKALDYCHIPFIEDPYNEADDVIASISSTNARKGLNVVISSNDSDFVQLVSENIVLVKSIRGKFVEYTSSYIEKKYGFEPARYLDYLSLKGDLSDNIGGVPGIGHVTAQKLVSQFGSVREILKNKNQLNNSLSKKLSKYEKLILDNYDFLSIDNNCPVSSVSDFSNKEILELKSNDILKALSLYE